MLYFLLFIMFSSFASFGATDIWQYLLLGFFVKKSWWYSSASKKSVNLSRVVTVGFFHGPFFRFLVLRFSRFLAVRHYHKIWRIDIGFQYLRLACLEWLGHVL